MRKLKSEIGGWCDGGTIINENCEGKKIHSRWFHTGVE
jgi:hypothetical protein